MSGMQLPLGIGLRPASTFATFVTGANGEAADYLARLRKGSVYLWGPPGSGKTHLLQSACHHAASEGRRACYLPLAHAGLAPAMLEGLEGFALVCIDDTHAIAGDDAWERSLFALFNGLRDAGGALALCADRSPRALGLGLADLSSRLAWGPVFQLHALDDDALAQALQLRARGLGLEMPEEVARYLVRHCVRDSTALFALLEALDRAALSAQRRLTVPFVKEFLRERSV